jgi:hypothetical protein
MPMNIKSEFSKYVDKDNSWLRLAVKKIEENPITNKEAATVIDAVYGITDHCTQETLT